MLDKFAKKESPIMGYAGFGGGVSTLLTLASGGPTYLEDVFSTFLYTGAGSAQTITNGIDLAGEGGLVWTKRRNNTRSHILFDSERGTSSRLMSDSTSGAANQPYSITMNSDGYAWSASDNDVTTGGNFCSWTFRKCPGFFDIVTWTTTTGSAEQIPHNLGSTPGMIIVKRTDDTSNWIIWHRSLSNSLNDFLRFDTADKQSAVGVWGSNAPNSTHFEYDGGASGRTFVAYLFAHNDGSFGEEEDEAVIKCGSYSGTGSAGHEINLGFEAQWVMVKRISGGTGNWEIGDIMRGQPVLTGSTDGNFIRANSNITEFTNYPIHPNPTGFTIQNFGGGTNASGSNYIYIAIRRPHKPPTAGTDVFGVVTRSGVNATANASSNASRFTDMVFTKNRGSGNSSVLSTRLQGQGAFATDNTSGEDNSFWSSRLFWDEQSGVRYAQYDQVNQSGSNYIDYFFTRAKGCFDVVAYTGTGSAGLTVQHGLGVTPEMMWIKKRTTTSGGDAFQIYHSSQGNGKYAFFGYDPFYTSGARWNNTSPTSTQFTLGTDDDVNTNTHKYVAMLFATLPGISKVGSYTGTGSSQNIDCGFTSGARFVMIKRADTEVQNPVENRTNWYVWDSARGIVSGNDPWIALNRAEAENTSTDWIDPLNSGFTVSHTGGSVNANGGTYIFLAFA